MKKILSVVVCCVCLCGCEDKNVGYQVSELIPDSGIGIAQLKGTLRNVSNNDCAEVKINVEISSGTIKTKGYVIVDSPKQNENISFDELFFGASDIDDIENYKIKFKSIECWVKKDTN